MYREGTDMVRRDPNEDVREQMEKQMRQQIASMKGMFESLDVEALDLSGGGETDPDAFSCFGSAGTIGCLTGCFGTAGTFGSAGFARLEQGSGPRR